MNLKESRAGIIAALIGSIVVVAHLALGMAAVVALGQWLSGAVIGGVIVVLATVHLLAGRHHRRRPSRASHD